MAEVAIQRLQDSFGEAGKDKNYAPRGPHIKT
jgi:hypothetical protein